MKQLLSLFLFLLPCLAWAQYPSNGNQKITLGEQTTADGLIYRGVLGDTLLITPSSDTSAYIILDTVNHRFYNYNRATNVWSMAGVGSISSGLTGVLPVANGGTNTTTLTANKVMVGNGTSGVLTPTDLHWNNSNTLLGIGETTLSTFKLTVKGDFPILFNTTSTANTLTYGGTRFFRNTSTLNNGNGFQFSFNNTSSAAAEYSYFGSYIIDNTAGSEDGGFILSPTLNATRTEAMRITNTGNVGIGQTTPTALLHLKAGTASPSTAPLKFTSQGASLLNPVEAGAVEFNGTNLFFTPSTTRHTVNHGLTGSATLNFPSTNAQLSADLTITVTGAADGDVVSLGVPNAAVNANTSYSAWVSAANTVTVRFNNYSSGTVDPASGLFKVFVTK
jgi:hypothetical protein